MLFFSYSDKFILDLAYYYIRNHCWELQLTLLWNFNIIFPCYKWCDFLSLPKYLRLRYEGRCNDTLDNHILLKGHRSSFKGGERSFTTGLLSCHQLQTCHTNDWGNAGSSDNGNIHLVLLWKWCTCIPLHSVFCYLPPPWLLFPMTANVVVSMRPIHHPFFLKGTLTAVNDCNKTKQ